MITGVDVARYNAAAQMKPYHKNLADFFERHPSRKFVHADSCDTYPHPITHPQLPPSDPSC